MFSLVVSLLMATADPDEDLADMIVSSAKIESGLCLHVGCGEGNLTLALSKRGRFLVYALEADQTRALKAQELIREQGCYGQAWVEHRPMDTLPLAENLVNLVVVSAAGGRVSDEEIERVLCPGGVAIKVDPDARPPRPEIFIRKPWPKEMDQWTHVRHGPDGNAVSHDLLVGPPERLRWLAGPLQKNNNIVTSNGRIFFGGLAARDAFNGLPLWEHEWAMDPRARQAWYGDRLLLAVDGDRVYSYIRKKATLVAVDAATGETLLKFADARASEQVLIADGMLVTADRSSVRGHDTASGQLLWRYDAVSPRCVIAGDGRLYLIHGDSRKGEAPRLVALDPDTGQAVWERSYEDWFDHVRYATYHDGLIALEVSTFNDDDQAVQLCVVNAEDGRLLWQRNYADHGGAGMAHKNQARGLFADGLLWVLHPGKFVGLDPRSGREIKSLPAAEGSRCFPPIGTNRYLFSGADRMTDLNSGETESPGITKGTCGTFSGFVPANGLIYGSPKHCVCFPMLRGFVALAPAREVGQAARPPDRQVAGPTNSSSAPNLADFVVERGLANAPAARSDSAAYPAPQEWPAYRRDARRSGHLPTSVPLDVSVLWQTELGDWQDSPLSGDWRDNPFVRGPITAPVIADGLCVVVRPDAHEVVALDAISGAPRWRYTANGRVDTPPTLYRGLCLFGTRSGFVTCLRLSDGQRIWRLRAAPVDERIVAFGQIESPWPVAGSVLVSDGVAYFTAGRQYRLDGGVLVFAVEPATGKIRWVTRADQGANIRYGVCSEFDPIDLMVAEDARDDGPGRVSFSRWRFDRASGEMDVDARSGFGYFESAGADSIGVVAPRGHWSYGPRHLPLRTVRRPPVAFRGNEIFGCSDSRSRVFRRDWTAEAVEAFNPIWYSKSKPVDPGTSRNLKVAEGARWFVKLFPEDSAPPRWSWLWIYNFHECHEAV